MREEQMEILRKQIAIYAVVSGQLVFLHESYSSILPLSSGMNPNFDPMVASSSARRLSNRHRWTPTSMQLQILESIYEKVSGPPSPRRIREITTELSQHGEIIEKSVYNWFQNRRARSKRKQPQTTKTRMNVQAADAALTTEERSSEGLKLMTIYFFRVLL